MVLPYQHICDESFIQAGCPHVGDPVPG